MHLCVPPVEILLLSFAPSVNKFEQLDWAEFSLSRLFFTILIPLVYFTWTFSSWQALFLYWVLTPILLIALSFTLYVLHMFIYSGRFDMSGKASSPLRIAEFVSYSDPQLAREYGNYRIPIETLFEAYVLGKVDFAGDLLAALRCRQQFSHFQLTQVHVRFLFSKLCKAFVSEDEQPLPIEFSNDFFEEILGPTMVHSSGIFRGNADETLEEAQTTNMELICRKIRLRESDQVLDVGCGWGTLVRFMAEKYRATVTGCTISREQKTWADVKIAENRLEDHARIECGDVCALPVKPYDKITCVEMAEQVDALKFGAFLKQVNSMLRDDGVFLLQITCLRRAWQFEDLIWGMFADRHASHGGIGVGVGLPLSWTLSQLEAAGFEVTSVDNIGAHRAATLAHWHARCTAADTRAALVQRYGEQAYRRWEWYLAWGIIAFEQGSAATWQIVAHKNTCTVDRSYLIHNRSDVWSL